ncbi:restriction endonuclease subunit S, partial [Mycoplasmopsis ciconiae]|nr:restriction endonuclease subunit S [Mycoplasmopsis ciconiae]
MTKLDKVPQIRFKGFVNDWEQQSLGNVTKLRGGYAFSKEQYKKTGLKIVRISNILSNNTIGGDFVYTDYRNDLIDFEINHDDILIAMSGATAGKIAQYKTTKNEIYYQNQRTGLFQRNINYIYNYLYTLLQTDDFNKLLATKLSVGAQPNFSGRDIEDFIFMVTKDKNEQTKIADLFTNLNSLITLNQRKLASLTQIKTSLLDKMFVSESESKPKIRF